MSKLIQKKNTQKLTELAREFQNASISDATRKAYQSDWKNFLKFCEYRKICSMPADGNTVCLFLTELADMGKSVSTIVRALTSINKAHELAGKESVRTPAVKTLLTGIKRTVGVSQSHARSISYSDILKMASHCDGSIIGTRDKALLMVGWCSALRRSELVALNIGDLDWCEQGVIITVRRSKTDQEGEGKQISIPFSKDIICPVVSLRYWLERLSKDARKKHCPVWRSIGVNGHKFWFNEVRGRLSDRMVAIIVKRYAGYAGFPSDQYSAHSLRRGLATEAGLRRIPERIIARHTRHASISVLRSYIDAGNIWDENPLSSIYSVVKDPAAGPLP